MDFDKQLAGILCPSFALRTATDLGVGDTEAVRQMIDWCHRHRFGVLQLLPINETSDDNSPYNAISSLAIEPNSIAVAPEHLPDLPVKQFKALATPKLLAELRRGPVQYAKVRALKRALLWDAFQVFLAKQFAKGTVRAEQFRAFVNRNGGWVSDYALFRVLMEEHQQSPTWDRWPVEHQDPKRAWAWWLTLPAKRREELTEKLLFFLYVQWIAFDQWTALKAYGTRRNVRLMGDIPFGVSRHSADAWANRSVFDLEWSGGAPPEKTFAVDQFTEKWGQNWGIPLYRWDALRARNFDWWRTRVDTIHQVFHLFRIDHVLGMFRIYAFPWRPEENSQYLPLTEAEAAQRSGGRLPGFRPFADDTPEHCEQNRQQGEELLAMVLEAAGDTTVVAEDLGVVPHYVPSSLEKLNVPGFKIPNFLRGHDGWFMDGKAYPRVSLAALATHDHPPIAATWRELTRKAEAGDPQAQHELRCWMKYAGLEGVEPPCEFDDRVHEAILRALLNSNSWLAVCLITDVFGQEARFNAPGAVASSNWTCRLDPTVEGMDQDPVLRAKTQAFARLVKETNRAAV